MGSSPENVKVREGRWRIALGLPGDRCALTRPSGLVGGLRRRRGFGRCLGLMCVPRVMLHGSLAVAFAHMVRVCTVVRRPLAVHGRTVMSGPMAMPRRLAVLRLCRLRLRRHSLRGRGLGSCSLSGWGALLSLGTLRRRTGRVRIRPKSRS